MPGALVGHIHAALTAALRSPAIESRLIELGFDVTATRPEQFADFQAREIARWREVVRRGAITADEGRRRGRRLILSAGAQA